MASRTIRPAHPFLERSPWSEESTTFDHTTAEPSLSEILALFDALVTDFPAAVVRDTIGSSVLGEPLYAYRILDDGVRPICGFSNGIHGNEKSGAAGLAEGLRLILDGSSSPRASDTIAREAYARLAFYVVPAFNPDGTAADQRRNANDVDLNDDWPFFWREDPSEFTGPTEFSQPESQAFRDWMETGRRLQRVYHWCDVHGWFSRDVFGFLWEQHFDAGAAQAYARALYLYVDELLRQRTWGDFAGGLLLGDPVWDEYRSLRKPFLYTYVSRAANPNATCWLLELPRNEYVGAHCRFMLDVVQAACSLGLDFLAARDGQGLVELPRASTPHPDNENSAFLDWFEAENRLSFFSHRGLRLTHYPNGDRATGDARPFVRSLRPNDDAWARAVAPGEMGAVLNTGAIDADDVSRFVVAGGDADAGPLDEVDGEALFSGELYSMPALPSARQHGALATDGADLYVFGGWDGTYRDEVLRLVGDPLGSAWTQVSTMPDGLQRHAAQHWKGSQFVVAGGRTATAYSSAIRVWDAATDTWSTLSSTLPIAMGWFASVIRGDVLWIFGGWSGATARSAILQVDLAADTITTHAVTLPAGRFEMAHAYDADADQIYLMLGKSGSATWEPDCYRFDFATETLATLAITLGIDGNTVESGEDGSQIAQPYRASAAAWWHPLDGKIMLVGGEDETGTALPTVLELELDTLELNIRLTGETRWGFLRDRTAFSVTPGDQYTIVAPVRAVQGRREDRAPYLRLTVLIGPLSAIQRRVMTGHLVPPIGEFTNLAMAVQIESGESEMRIYVRHYGGGTLVDIGGLQLHEGRPDLVTHTPTDGVADGTRELGLFLRSDAAALYRLEGVVSPHSMSQTDADSLLATWSMDGALQYVRVRHLATRDRSSPDDPTRPDFLQGHAPTGFLRIEWSDGTPASEDIWDPLPLNHGRTSREWRRDVLSWRFEFGPDGDATVARLTLGWYGRTYVRTWTLGSATTLRSMTQHAGSSWNAPEGALVDVTSAWPADLPSALLVKGYSEAGTPAMARHELESGPAYVRRRLSTARAGVSGAIWCTAAQVTTLLAWFRDDLRQGRRLFRWAHPRTGEPARFRFAAPPQIAEPAGDFYAVTLDLERMP